MSRCIVKQSLSQPVAVAPVAPVAQVSPVSVSPVSVTPVSVSVTVTAAQPVSEASGVRTDGVATTAATSGATATTTSAASASTPASTNKLNVHAKEFTMAKPADLHNRVFVITLFLASVTRTRPRAPKRAEERAAPRSPRTRRETRGVPDTTATKQRPNYNANASERT
ncbi:hypothetical protein B5X24_HaOG215173 [Helicoverpa armigera]|nr:hypothetical protein B5X24_HaOG215173 [Helicoverpa armigera]